MIIKRQARSTGAVRGLSVIMNRLKPYNLLEVKGPTDSLGGLDLLRLLGYTFQLMVFEQISSPEEVCLFTISDGIPEGFRRQVAACHGTMVDEGDGVWRVDGLMHTLYCIDTFPSSQMEGNGLLYLFSRTMLKAPSGIWELLTPDEMKICSRLTRYVVQLERDRKTTTYKEFDIMKTTIEQAWDALIEAAPIERRLKGLTAEQVLKRFNAEERLRGLGPEERLRGLGPEDLIRALGPETRERLRRLLNQETNPSRTN